MSEECVQNAATAAARRREIRRQKLLQSPEQRMKKIMGHSLPGNEPVKIHPGDRIGDAGELDGNTDRNNDRAENNSVDQSEEESSVRQRNQPQHHQARLHLDSAEDQSANSAPGSSPLNNLFANNTELREDSLSDADGSDLQGTRHVLCAVLGVLTRLSFLCSFGEEYVQTIMYPFMFFEIAFIGYQILTGMDLGAGVKGGLWLSVLVLAGIKREVVETYKSVMGAFTSAADDFTVFFFTFVFTHLFV